MRVRDLKPLWRGPLPRRCSRGAQPDPTYDELVTRHPVAVIVALSLCGLLTCCGLQQSVGESSQQGATTPTAAPAINATTLSGGKFTSASARGHPLVIDFWASWCGPCRAEQGDINKLHSKYASRGVVFVGVDMRDDNAAAQAYEQGYAVPYPSVVDADEQISAAYNVTAPPTVVLVDRHGNIVQRYLGTIAGLSEDLDHLL